MSTFVLLERLEPLFTPPIPPPPRHTPSRILWVWLSLFLIKIWVMYFSHTDIKFPNGPSFPFVFKLASWEAFQQPSCLFLYLFSPGVSSGFLNCTNIEAFLKLPFPSFCMCHPSLCLPYLLQNPQGIHQWSHLQIWGQSIQTAQK